ncbi:polysaccharide export protein [Palleronia caenipelagi]|uniref:Polysaccharide export protein n=1 Tax=Palleronia caenipelagi TaxID=2489174 RepID=A0A547Q5G1_9RHOB|nr:polysaccharide export protein [Palleronia caenipelagi]
MALLAGCGLPRSGPTKPEIYAGSVEREGDAFVVPVTRWVTTATAAEERLTFSPAFTSVGKIGADTIRAGDTLSLTIYENVDDGLLSPVGASASTIAQIQVNADGYIYVPYAGRIRAAGNSPEAIRQIISARLGAQTPDPQVSVARAAGTGATVSIVGNVGLQGVQPIESFTRTLTAMLAASGGISVDPEVALVTVSRGGREEKVWLQDIYENPGLDIALRDGDRILVEADPRTYTVLGTAQGGSVLQFEERRISALQAIGQMGGLNPTSADPTGVFVLRDEPQNIARTVLGRDDLVGPQRMIYVLDLTKPNGLFEARDFSIKDDDTIFVTEAPYAQFAKIISTITSSAGSVTGLSNQIDNF